MLLGQSRPDNKDHYDCYHCGRCSDERRNTEVMWPAWDLKTRHGQIWKICNDCAPRFKRDAIAEANGENNQGVVS